VQLLVILSNNCRIFLILGDAALLRLTHRDILLEASSSQKVCTSESTGDQGGEPTLGQ